MVYGLVYAALVIGFASGYVIGALLAANRHHDDCEFCARVRSDGRVDFRA